MFAHKLSRYTFFALVISLTILAAGLGTSIRSSKPAYAQSPTEQNEPSQQSERPFQLPFAEPSGPDTWLLGQPYGNTIEAYFQRNTLYVRSGGIHFGLDLSAPCGTEIVAIADGVVYAVDGPFGSAPHNLMIDHPQLGYASMYGHLLEAPDLMPGQRVKQGEAIALVGDSEGICHRRPHLHLEIRDLKHFRKYNPIPLIEANWDNLALTGSSGRGFMRDLAQPRKWQTLYDQPEAWIAGPIINDFEATWPFDWSQRDSGSARLASPEESAARQTPTPDNTLQPLLTTPVGWQITSGQCCTRPYWSQDEDSTQVRFIDQPAPDEALGVWGVDLTGSDPRPRLITEQLAVYRPDGNLIAYPGRDKGVAILERPVDGQRWEVDTQGHGVSFTPDSQGLIWTAYDEDEPWDTREETIWLANLDGGNARAIFSSRRSNLIAWLSDDELLMVQGFEDTSDVQLFKLSVKDGAQTTLMEGPRMRGLALSPDKRHLVYYVRFEPDAEKNGVWLLDLQAPTQAAQKLPFFGTYRWRDDQRLICVPLDPDAAWHDFYEYNIRTGQSRPLFPDGTNLTIANNDWQVSPDGSKIALVAAKGAELDGIWVIDIDQADISSRTSPPGLSLPARQ
jgi:hypothetical protein